jgi:hypothetical protein
MGTLPVAAEYVWVCSRGTPLCSKLLLIPSEEVRQSEA